jgi:arginine deiminase
MPLADDVVVADLSSIRNRTCLGGRKLICCDLCDGVYEPMLRCDFEVCRTPGSELVKGRGGPRCMTRPIYRRPLA